MDEIKIKVENNVYDTILKESKNYPTKEESIKKKKEEQLKIGTVNFTEKELETMPKQIKKLIIVNRKRCRIRKKNTGKNSFSYEIRFRCDGYNVSASGPTIEQAKANMLNKLITAKPTQKKNENSIPTTFSAFSEYYFENFRKEQVAEITMYKDLNRYKRYLKPFFKEKEIKKITPLECKELLESVKNKGKTCDELYSLMNIIFKQAIMHNIIENNPLNTVLHIKHEKEHAKVRTQEEQDLLLNSNIEPKYKILIALLLYTGMRPNELQYAKIEGKFIVTRNSKRKNKKIEYKKIPIIKRLKPFLVNGIPEERKIEKIREAIKSVLPDGKPYDLRKTFYTKCQELKLNDVARDLIVGHSLDTLEKTYTEVSDEFLLKEGKKLDKW